MKICENCDKSKLPVRSDRPGGSENRDEPNAGGT